MWNDKDSVGFTYAHSEKMRRNNHYICDKRNDCRFILCLLRGTRHLFGGAFTFSVLCAGRQIGSSQEVFHATWELKSVIHFSRNRRWFQIFFLHLQCQLRYRVERNVQCRRLLGPLFYFHRDPSRCKRHPVTGKRGKGVNLYFLLQKAG